VLPDVVRDLGALVDAVLAVATHRDSMLHGEAHWRCVAWTGLALWPEVARCDAAVLFMFSLLHDTQRLNDGHDPEHGLRAAELARRLHGEGLFRLPGEGLEMLCHACAEHTSGGVSSDPTVGACWDADRLNLWRVKVRPDPQWLSTAAGKKSDRINWAARFEGRHKTWREIYEGYCGL
jgi:uncharacterized protein